MLVAICFASSILFTLHLNPAYNREIDSAMRFLSQHPGQTVIAWWDWGYWITAIGHSRPVWNNGYMPPGTLKDVSQVYILHPNSTVEIMRRYNATFLIVSHYDYFKLYNMVKVLYGDYMASRFLRYLKNGSLPGWMAGSTWYLLLFKESPNPHLVKVFESPAGMVVIYEYTNGNP